MSAQTVDLRRGSHISAGVAAVGGLLLVGALFLHGREAALSSWLYSFQWILGLPLGALGLRLLHQVAGGRWGRAIDPIAAATIRTWPLLVLAFMPIALSISKLYVWAAPDAREDPLIAHKAAYLNQTFFLGRAALYFVIWIGLSILVDRKIRREGSFRYAGPFLVLYALTVSFAAFDWGMSLEPHWFSTIYGLLFVAADAVSALCLCALVASVLLQEGRLGPALNRDRLHDVGKLIFAFLMLWAYVNFSQLLIIWSADLPEEVPWYARRIAGGWDVVAASLFFFGFLLPFLLLLSRNLKRNARWLGGVASGLLLARALEDFFLVIPAFRPLGFSVQLADLAAPIFLGGCFSYLFVRSLEQKLQEVRA